MPFLSLHLNQFGGVLILTALYLNTGEGLGHAFLLVLLPWVCNFAPLVVLQFFLLFFFLMDLKFVNSCVG